MNSTNLRQEYTNRSWNYELPDDLEQALEDDYVQNSHLYSDDTFNLIKMIFLLNPKIESQEILELVRFAHQVLAKLNNQP